MLSSSYELLLSQSNTPKMAVHGATDERCCGDGESKVSERAGGI